MALGLVSLFLVIFGNAGIYHRGYDHKKLGLRNALRELLALRSNARWMLIGSPVPNWNSLE